ncbi:MAG: amidohydrolase [Rudaea sp.]|uniref:amidohydrolase n=1 Tax=Rudaea sp. 3F27F6 TaxID=2502208 RepID=UPI0010F43EE6|nr:amidohydrolase [Rudaea sp. 3F27F6]MBN8886772.1 amidohydrolase [Rudaea sp.]MBR0347818.1 amidohydrolase [Rudaea sp.]
MIVLRRVCVFAVAALLAVPAVAADLFVDHVNGYTLDSAGKLQRFEAMLVEQGRVVATGSHADLAQRSGGAQVLDGKGRTLIPGLIDAHGHVMGLGIALRQADLTATKSLADALAAVKTYAAAHVDMAWVEGRGWNQAIWKLGRFPTARELDGVVADRPVWLERVDGHAGWANSAAIKLAGIDANTKDPAGGRIERDAAGKPSGVFVDAAMELITAKIPAMTAAEAEKALDAALAEMAKNGLTGAHDAGIDADTVALFKRYADAHKLSARIYALIGGTGKDFDRLAVDGPLTGYGGGFLDVRAVKLYADGALGSRGAALLAPYSDDAHNKGLLFHKPDELTAMIAKAIGKGYQVGVHAIGDAANREVLDSFAAVYKTQGGKDLRNRIEHAQIVAPEDIPRFRELNLIASMQPTHATSDMNMAEDRLGKQRMQGAYAWRTFLRQGTVVAGGSDFPVESPNPFYGLYSAVTRQDHDGRPPGGWYPQQALTLTEALRAFTLDAAYAGHAEKTLGTLEPGKCADFLLIDRDIFAGKPAQIWSTVVLETWVGGRRVYARGAD